MKEKLIVGFDLDDTLVNLQKECYKIANKYNIKQYAKDWNFSNYPGECKQEIYEMFKNPEIMCNLKPFNCSKKLIKWLQNNNHKVFIITNRSENIYNETVKWVKDLFGINPIITKTNEEKVNILRELGVELYIDDCPLYLKDIQKLGIQTILISNRSTLYNKYAKSFCFWLRNIKEVYNYLR